jgi:hypothetical protein
MVHLRMVSLVEPLIDRSDEQIIAENWSGCDARVSQTCYELGHSLRSEATSAQAMLTPRRQRSAHYADIGGHVPKDPNPFRSLFKVVWTMGNTSSSK